MRKQKHYASPSLDVEELAVSDVISTSPAAGGGDLDQDIGEWDDEM